GRDVGAVVQPGTLLFTATAGGGSPGSQNLLVYNVAAAAKSFRSATDAANIVSLPKDAVLDPLRPTEIVIQPFTDRLPPGIYSNTITFQFSDGRVSRVAIKVIVSAGPLTSTARFTTGAHGTSRAPVCSPTKLQPALTTLSDAFAVSA